MRALVLAVALPLLWSCEAALEIEMPDVAPEPPAMVLVAR